MVVDSAKLPKQAVHSPNSALHWLPRLAASPELVPHLPQTQIVPYKHSGLISMMEGEGEYPHWSELVDEVERAADTVGWPAFIRTDLASAKHCGPEAYLARTKSDLPRVLCQTAEDNELKFWLSANQPIAFLIRQFLSLDAPFRAFAGLPIAREWRFYATPDEVLCAHPYWPEGSIRFRNGCHEPANWREQLLDLHQRPGEGEWEQLMQFARAAAVAASDRAMAWSVDFARDLNQNWWLIDMALMEQSWHWPECPNASNSTGSKSARDES